MRMFELNKSKYILTKIKNDLEILSNLKYLI